MGLPGNSEWSAEWIENPDYTYATNNIPNPLPIFAKDFDLSRKVAKARLYVTGLGMYAAKLNGEPVGEAVLEPGQTTYFREVNYRTYDVTGLLRRDDNLLGIETGSGAYQRVPTPGRYFFQPNNPPGFPYGTPKAIAQLEVTYANGSRRTIATDEQLDDEAGRHHLLRLVVRRGVRRSPDANGLDRAAPGQRPRLARGARGRALVGHDARGYDAAGRRPAAPGDGRL